jgi:cytochrome c
MMVGKKSVFLLLAGAAAWMNGCAGAQTAADGPAGGGDQVAMGAKLYAAKCADCHGNGGEGRAGAPALVGKGALPLDPPPGSKFRKGQFHTAEDVFKFVKATMPPNAPGSLSDAEVAAIIAFDLKANGVAMTGKTVDAAHASAFVLH